MKASSFRETDPALIHNSPPLPWSYSNLLLFNCRFLTSFQAPVQFYSNYTEYFFPLVFVLFLSYNTLSHCFSYRFFLTILFPIVFTFVLMPLLIHVLFYDLIIHVFFYDLIYSFGLNCRGFELAGGLTFF